MLSGWDKLKTVDRLPVCRFYDVLRSDIGVVMELVDPDQDATESVLPIPAMPEKN